jgi:hypothetical protein
VAHPRALARQLVVDRARSSTFCLQRSSAIAKALRFAACRRSISAFKLVFSEVSRSISNTASTPG